MRTRGLGDIRLSDELVARFAADLDALVESDARVGVAVSGGLDSVALLLLAAAARPERTEAATVDHGHRPESRAEAEMVARLCERLQIPHRILTAAWEQPPAGNLQAKARELRYRLLGGWALEQGLPALATGHQLDDQAETLLMRIARGSGVGGLAGIQRQRPLAMGGEPVALLVRPLIGWRRAQLRKIVADAGLRPVDDPSNSDRRFDRSRARALLETTDWLDPARLAAVTENCADAEAALDWAARREFEARCESGEGVISLDPAGLPRELRRRLLSIAIGEMTGETPPGPKLMAALEALDAGRTTTLVGLKLEGGPRWRIGPAPPRRS